MAWDLVGFSLLHTSLFKYDMFFGTDVSELTPFASDVVFLGVLTTFCIDGSDIIASLDLVPNVPESFGLYFISGKVEIDLYQTLFLRMMMMRMIIMMMIHFQSLFQR